MYVYNLTGAQRKIEHVGEITIKCTNGVSCSITFPKSGYSTQKNEFYGDIIFDNVNGIYVSKKRGGRAAIYFPTILCLIHRSLVLVP